MLAPSWPSHGAGNCLRLVGYDGRIVCCVSGFCFLDTSFPSYSWLSVMAICFPSWFDIHPGEVWKVSWTTWWAITAHAAAACQEALFSPNFQAFKRCGFVLSSKIWWSATGTTACFVLSCTSSYRSIQKAGICSLSDPLLLKRQERPIPCTDRLLEKTCSMCGLVLKNHWF